MQATEQKFRQKKIRDATGRCLDQVRATRAAEAAQREYKGQEKAPTQRAAQSERMYVLDRCSVLVCRRCVRSLWRRRYQGAPGRMEEWRASSPGSQRPRQVRQPNEDCCCCAVI